MDSLTQKNVLVSHYSYRDYNEMGIVMEDRFNRTMQNFIESSIRGTEITETRIVVMIGKRSMTNPRCDVLASVAVKRGRKGSILVDVLVSFDIDENGQQTYQMQISTIDLSY